MWKLRRPGQLGGQLMLVANRTWGEPEQGADVDSLVVQRKVGSCGPHTSLVGRWPAIWWG
jgi:hypothetical protein